VVDTSGGGKGKPTVSGEVTDFFKKSAAWAAGGLACYLKYNAMKTITRQRMVTSPPAVLFVALYSFLNYKGYKYSVKQIKENGKDSLSKIRHIKASKQ
jgi:hypothetical protein